MGKNMGSQRRPSARMKSNSTAKSKLKGTTKRSPKGYPSKGKANGMGHEKGMC